MRASHIRLDRMLGAPRAVRHLLRATGSVAWIGGEGRFGKVCDHYLMPGAEIAIAGGAAKALEALTDEARKAVKSDRDAVRDAARDSTGLERAGQLYGQRLAIKEQVILNLWKPLARFFGVSKDYFENDFPRELAAKLESIPDEELVTPKAAVVAPAMEALGYSLEEPNLKEMYLNLLAAASTGTRSRSVHPSFVDTIRQLDSEEALLLNTFLRARVECARIKLQRPVGGYVVKHEYVVQWVDSATHRPTSLPPRLTEWINNWERLGLVDATYSEHSVSPDPDVDLYSWVKERPEFIAAEAELPVVQEGDGPSPSIVFDRGLIRPTARGRAFYSAVGEPVQASSR